MVEKRNLQSQTTCKRRILFLKKQLFWMQWAGPCATRAHASRAVCSQSKPCALNTRCPLPVPPSAASLQQQQGSTPPQLVLHAGAAAGSHPPPQLRRSPSDLTMTTGQGARSMV
jgi:hypothetical protein